MAERVPIKSLNGHEIMDEKARKDIDAINEVIDDFDSNTTTITGTGTVVSIDVAEGTEINVKATTAETVTLYHSGKNRLPSNPMERTVNGLTVSSNSDGTVTFSGTPTITTFINVVDKTENFYLPAGTYRIMQFGLPTYTGTDMPISYIIQTVDGSKVFNGSEHFTITGNTSTPVVFTLTQGTYVFAMYRVSTLFTGEEVTCGVMVGANVSEYVAPTVSKMEVHLPVALPAYDGANIIYTESGETLKATAKVPKKDSVDEDAVNALIAKATQFDSTVWGMRVLDLNGDCTGMTKKVSVPLDAAFTDKDGNYVGGVADVKKQGSSSITIGAEIGAAFDTDIGGLFNLTITFPEAFEAAEGWGAQKKYCVKVNAIDHSHARNICSCKLWGEIVKNRANVPSELSSLPNGGAIDGFPVIVTLNGKFYALGTFNIPKDGWMFGSPKAILCADTHCDATKFKTLATLDGDFELEYVEDENNADWVLTSINMAIQAVMDSDGSDLDTVVGQYIDIPSAIDYYIHTVEENADDGTSKNYILVTFDGVKWYFSAYDRDTTYGIKYDGTTFHNNVTSGITFGYYASIHGLMHLIYNNKRAALKARAVELRNRIKSEHNVYNVFTNFCAGIPAEVYAQNCRRWPLLRSTSVNNVYQILNWYRMRRQAVDEEIDGWTV